VAQTGKGRGGERREGQGGARIRRLGVLVYNHAGRGQRGGAHGLVFFVKGSKRKKRGSDAEVGGKAKVLSALGRTKKKNWQNAAPVKVCCRASVKGGGLRRTET